MAMAVISCVLLLAATRNAALILGRFARIKLAFLLSAFRFVQLKIAQMNAISMEIGIASALAPMNVTVYRMSLLWWRLLLLRNELVVVSGKLNRTFV